MTQAADLIEHLLARSPGRIVLEKRSGMPYGWGIWMRSGKAAATTAFARHELIAHADTRPPRRAGGLAPQLGLWQAFRRLWWQHWDPRPRDQRDLHWFGVLGSALVHVLFLALLLWVAVVRWAAQEPEPEQGRVQFSLLGRGTPEDQGGGEGGTPMAAAATNAGGAAARARPRSTAASAAAGTHPAAELQAPAMVEAEPASPPLPERVTPATAPPTPVEPSPPAPMVIDPVPLQATETPVARTDFVVPPPPAIPTRETPLAQPEPPQVRERQVETLERPQPMQVRPRELATPSMPPLPVATVREREVTAAPRPSVELALPMPRQPVPALVAPDVAVRQRELPDVPEQAPAAEPTKDSPREAPPASAAASSTPAGSLARGERAAPAGNLQALNPPGASAGRQAGAGPRPADRSGGWASPKAGDDWGLGERNQAGRQAGAAAQGEGLYDRDGSVRVPGQGEAAGRDGRGAPGSETDTWSRDRIAQSGTWLKRPPYDYSPTSLDKYWVPNESLLEEWVRKGIKKIEIAIPGTSTRISCVVSLLQFGGGCGLTDPNMNEQPASARPPPDIPFKKELQEDNGSLR